MPDDFAQQLGPPVTLEDLAPAKGGKSDERPRFSEIPTTALPATIPNPKDRPIGPTAAEFDPALNPRMPHGAGAAEGGEEAYIARNQRPGVPLDIHDELGKWMAFKTSLRHDKTERLKYLANQFGIENVRADEHGEPLVTVTDPQTGKKKDIPLNAPGLTVNDLMTIAGSVPQMAEAAAGTMLGRKIPGIGQAGGGLGKLRDFAAGAVGMEAGAGAQQAATRAWDELPVNWSDILKEHGKAVPMDVAADYALGVVPGKALELGTRAIRGEFGLASPLAFMRRDVQKGAIAGAQLIEQETGQKMHLTAAETSGVPLLAKMYEYFRKHPSGAGPIATEQEAKDTAKKLFQEYMIKPTSLADDEQIGNDVLAALNQITGKAAKATQTAAETAAEGFQKGISKTAGIGPAGAAGLGGPGSPAGQAFQFGPVGENIRKKVVAGRDAAEAAQSKMRQDIAQMEGGTGKVFESGPIGLQDRAAAQLKSLPAPEKTMRELAYDQYGNPTQVTKTGQVLEREFVPDKVVARLKSLTEEKKYSLSDLIQMRSDVYEDITAGQAVPNTGTHYLNEIGKMLTGAIQEGIDKLPNPQLKAALQKANAQYIGQVLPYKESGVGRLFKRPDEPGFVEGTDFVKGLLKSPEKYSRVVGLMGKNSPEHQQLKQAVSHQLILDSADDLEGKIINPEKLIQNLQNMAKDQSTRPIYQDVFGGRGQSMVNEAQFLSLANKLKGGKVTAEEVQDILSGKAGAPTSLVQAADAYRKQQKLYSNNVIKKLVSGEMDPDQIKAGDFVNKFLDVADTKDIAQVWGHLSGHPDIQDQVRRKLIEKVFANARRSMEPGDVAAMLKEDPTHVVSSQGMAEALGDSVFRKKLELVVGKKPVELLKAYTSVQAAEDWAKQQAGGTGMLVSGNVVGNVLRMIPPSEGKSGGITREAMEFAKYKLLSVMLTSTGFRKLLNSTYSPKEISWLIPAIVTSEPFVRAVVEDMPDNSSAMGVLKAAKAMVGLRQDDKKPAKPSMPSRAQAGPGVHDLPPDEAALLTGRKPQ